MPGDVCIRRVRYVRCVRRVFCARAMVFYLRCADAGHPPGLFAE